MYVPLYFCYYKIKIIDLREYLINFVLCFCGDLYSEPSFFIISRQIRQIILIITMYLFYFLFVVVYCFSKYYYVGLFFFYELDDFMIFIMSFILGKTSYIISYYLQLLLCINFFYISNILKLNDVFFAFFILVYL